MPIFNHNLPIKANVIQGEGGTDTSQDTVTPETLLEGVTAHNAAGEQIVGTCDYNANTERDTVTADKLVLGETAHDASGQPVTGTLDTEAIRAEGIEAGKKSEYDAFWDTYQEYGNRTEYVGAFEGKGWTTDTIKPKYDIIPMSVRRMLANTERLHNTDFGKIIKEAGVVFDTSNVSKLDGFDQFLEYTSPAKLPIISTISAPALRNVFFYSSFLKEIEKLVLKEDGTQTFTNPFIGCSKLTTLPIEGTIGQNGFDVSWSPLNKASLTSIINALSDTTTGLTVTLRLSAIKKAFETSEGANDGAESTEWQNLVMSKPNWTINAIDS